MFLVMLIFAGYGVGVTVDTTVNMGYEPIGCGSQFLLDGCRLLGKLDVGFRDKKLYGKQVLFSGDLLLKCGHTVFGMSASQVEFMDVDVKRFECHPVVGCRFDRLTILASLPGLCSDDDYDIKGLEVRYRKGKWALSVEAMTYKSGCKTEIGTVLKCTRWLFWKGD